MLQKRKKPKPKKSIVEMLMRDMQGTAAEKLALFEKLKAAGGFANAPAAENMLRTFGATERSARR